MQRRVVVPHVELQRDLRELQGLIAQVSHSVEGAVEGAWSEAYARAMATFGTGAGADQIKALTDTAEQLARYGEKTRADAAYYKNMIVIQLNLFLVEWSLIMAMAVWNPFGALAEQAVLRATYRAVLRSLIFRFLAGLAAQEVLNVGLAAATHEFAKWLTSEQGYTLEDSDELLKQAVGFGALQGVFGAFVPFVGGALGGLLGKAFGRDAAGALRGAVDAALAEARQVKGAGRDVAGEVAGSGVRPVAADFGRDLAGRTVNLARVLREVRPGAVSDEVFTGVGEVFARELGAVMGDAAARRVGEEWARAFTRSFGGRGMEAALAVPLRALPRDMGALRRVLSQDVARVFAPDFGRKVASLAGEAALWGGAMNLAEGTYNAITTGHFTTSLASFTSGAFGALLGHAGAHLGGKAGWKLRSALGLGRTPTVSTAGAGGAGGADAGGAGGAGAGGVNTLPGPGHPLLRPAGELRFTPPRTVSDGLPSYYRPAPDTPLSATTAQTAAHTAASPQAGVRAGAHPDTDAQAAVGADAGIAGPDVAAVPASVTAVPGGHTAGGAASAGPSVRWEEFQRQRDAAYHGRLAVAEATRGAVEGRLDAAREEFTRQDLFGGGHLPQDETGHEQVRDAYRTHVREQLDVLAARVGGFDRITPEQQRQVVEQVSADLPRMWERVAQRHRHEELFQERFERAVADYRRQDLFGGRYLVDGEPAAGVHENVTAAERRIREQEALQEAREGRPPVTLHQLRTRLETSYRQAVEDAYRAGGPDTPAARRELDAHLARMYDELPRRIDELAVRERQVAPGLAAFDDLTAQVRGIGRELPDPVVLQARADLAEQLRTAHTVLREHHAADPAGFETGWQQYVREATGDRAVLARLEYAQVREERVRQARDLFHRAADAFEDGVAQGAPLGEAGRERLAAAFDKDVERAVDADWFGHQGHHDFRRPPRPEGADAQDTGGLAAGDAVPSRPFEESLDALHAGLPRRMVHEFERQTVLERAGQDFHALAGHPDSPAHHYDVDEPTLERLGEEFRADTLRVHDRIQTDADTTLRPAGEEELTAWLRHEARHENVFQQAFTTARTTPLPAPRDPGTRGGAPDTGSPRPATQSGPATDARPGTGPSDTPSPALPTTSDPHLPTPTRPTEPTAGQTAESTVERPPVADAGNARRTEDAYAVMAGAPVRTQSAASHPAVSTERATAETGTAAVVPAASQATAGRSRWRELVSASPDDASLLQVHVRGELQRLGHTVAGPLSAAVAQHYDELDPAWDTHSVQRRAAAVAHRIAAGDDLPLSRWQELTQDDPGRASALRVLAAVELQRAQYPVMPLTAEDFAHAYDRLADTWHAQPLGDQATALAHRIRTGTDLPPHALTPTTPGRAGAVLDHAHAQRLDLTVRAELAAAGHPAQDLTPGRALVLHHFLDPAWHTTSPGHQAEAVARWIRTETRPGPPAQTRTTPTRPATMPAPAPLATGTSTTQAPPATPLATGTSTGTSVETSVEASVAGSRGAAPAREDDRFLIEEVRREFRNLHPDGIVPLPTDADIRMAAGILPERPGRVTLRQRGEEIAQFLLTGDKVRFLGGANSAETELLRQLIVTNGPEVLAGTVLAQHPSGASVVMEVSAAREHAGQLYLPGSAGTAGASTVHVFIPEIVLPPLGVLPGEHSRVAAGDGMRLLQEVQQALRNAAPSVSGRPVSLASVLPPGWTVTDAGRRIYMGNTVRGAEQRTYTQFTIGVPVAALAGVHETALEHLTYRMLAPLMHSARRFADRLAAVYAQARIGRPVTPGQVPFLASSVAGLEELRGYGWLLYAHGAAVPAQKRLYPGSLTKNLLVAASRNSFALIRSSLHPELRAFLADAGRQAQVVDLFLTEFDDFLARRRNTARRGADGTRHILEDGLTGAAERTVGEYLDTMLTDIPAEDQVSQYQGVGMRDYPLDTHEGAFPEGLVLLELRQFGGDENQQTDDEVRTAFTGLVRVARQAYEEAGRLRSQAATHPAVPGVVLDHPLVSVLTAVFERTAEVHVPVPGRRTPALLLPGTKVRQLASMAASFALGGPLPPGVEQAMGALAQRTRQALAGTTAPEQARRLEDVLAAADYAQAHLQAVTALNNGLGRPATAEEITTASALGSALGRPARPDETVAVTAVLRSLPQDVRGNVSEYQTLTAYQAYFQSHGGDPSSPQAHQAAVRYAGAVLTGSRRTQSSSLAAMLGGSRDAGTDPLAGQWPLGRSFTSAGPRTDGIPPARVPADRVPTTADAGRRPGEWHVITQPHPHSSTGFSYRVHNDGRIRLPDGTELPPGPWVPYGHDFVLDHPDTALHLLRSDSGWIGRPDNAETVRSILEPEVWYHLTPGPDGLVLVPDEEAATDQAVHISVPLTAEAPAAEATGTEAADTTGSAAEAPATATATEAAVDARGAAPLPEDDQHLHPEVRREYARLRPGTAEALRPPGDAEAAAPGASLTVHPVIEAAVPLAVARMGREDGGARGLVNMAPVPGYVLGGLHESVIRKVERILLADGGLRAVTEALARFRGAEGPVREDVTARLTPEFLASRQRQLLSAEGLRVPLRTLGSRDQALWVRMRLAAPRPAASELFEVPAGIQRWGMGFTSVDRTEGTSDLRSVNLAGSYTWPYADAPVLRSASATGQLSVTHNQRAASASVATTVWSLDYQAGHGEPGFAYDWDAAIEWRIAPDPARATDADADGDARETGWQVQEGSAWQQRTWFPEHLLHPPAPHPGGPLTPAPLADLLEYAPLLALEAFPWHEKLHQDVVEAFGDLLKDLSQASRDALRHYLSEANFRGGPRMLLGEHASPLLFAANGDPLGFLTLRLDLTLAGPAHEGLTTRNTVLEFDVVRTMRATSSTSVTNAVGVSVGAGVGLLGQLNLSGRLGTRFAETYALNAGGSVLMSRGLRSARPHLLRNAVAVPHITLVRADGPPVQPMRGPLTSDIHGYPVILRVPSTETVGPPADRSTPADDSAVADPSAHADRTTSIERPAAGDQLAAAGPTASTGRPDAADQLTSADRTPPADQSADLRRPPRHAPRDVRELRSLSLSVTPLRLDGAEAVFQHIEEQLRSLGFLPARSPEKNGDVTQQWQRLSNARQLAEARSAVALRDLVAQPRDLYFTRSTAFGSETVVAHLGVRPRPADAPGEGITHVRHLPGVRMLNFVASWTDGTEQRTRTSSAVSAGLSVSSRIPTGNGALGGVGLGLDYGYGHGTSVTDAVSTQTGQENYLITSDGLDVFQVPLVIGVEFSSTRGHAIEAAESNGQARLAVPPSRTLDAPHQDGPSPQHGIRAVTEEDERMLGLRRSGAVTGLPGEAFVDRLEGSATVREAMHRLLLSFRTDHEAQAEQEEQPEAQEAAGQEALRERTAEADEEAEPGPMPGAYPPEPAPGEGLRLPLSVAGQGTLAGTRGPGVASGAVAGARGLLGRAVSLAVDAGRYLRTTAVGPAMEDPAALAQAVVRTVASHSHLLDKLPQILNGSLDFGTQSTGVVGTRVEFKVEGYFKNVTRGLESPAEGALVTERWHVSGRGSGVTLSSSSSHSGSPVTQVGLAFSQGGMSGRYGLGVGRNESDTRSDGATGYRITSQSGGRLVWFRADLTMVIEARRGRHQLLHDLVSDLGSRDPEVRRTVVEIPQAVDFFISERDLVRYPRLAEIAGLTDLPAPPPRDLPLPMTYISSGGSVGTGTVTEVTEVTEVPEPTATAGAAGAAVRKALRQTVEDLVENIAPGSTTVGRGAHVPGLRERIGELTSPRNLQALIAARHSSVSFVANSWLGPRLVRISLTANPAPGFESVLGRPVAPGTDLETQFVRATGKGSPLPAPGTTGHSTSRSRTNELGLTLSGSGNGVHGGLLVSDGVRDTVGQSAGFTSDERVWLHTVAEHVADYPVPYDIAMDVSSSLLPNALLLIPQMVLHPRVHEQLTALASRAADASGLNRLWSPWSPLTVRATARVDATLRLGAADATPVGTPTPVEPSIRTEDPVVPLRPPVDASVVSFERLLKGDAWQPHGPFEIQHFDALPHLAQALRQVTPTLRGHRREFAQSLSTEGMLTRLRELVASGEPHARGAEQIAPFLGGPGVTGTSLRVQLYEPFTVSASVDTSLDDVRVTTESHSSRADTAMSPTVGVQTDFPLTGAGDAGMSAGSALAGDRPQAGQSTGASSQLRDYLRSGTTGESVDGAGVTSYQVAAVAKVTVQGPTGERRYVVGNLYLHTVERPPAPALNRAELSAAADDAVRAIRRHATRQVDGAGHETGLSAGHEAGSATEHATSLLAELRNAIRQQAGAGTRPAVLPTDLTWHPVGDWSSLASRLRGLGPGTLALVRWTDSDTGQTQALGAYLTRAGDTLWTDFDAPAGERTTPLQPGLSPAHALAVVFDATGTEAETAGRAGAGAREPSAQDEPAARSQDSADAGVRDAADTPPQDSVDTVEERILQLMRGSAAQQRPEAEGDRETQLLEEPAAQRPGPAVSTGLRALTDLVDAVADEAERERKAAPEETRPGLGDPAWCVLLLERLMAARYPGAPLRDGLRLPGGARPAATADDSVLGAPGTAARLAPGGGWARVESWQALADATDGAGPNATALVLWSRRHGAGHAFAYAAGAWIEMQEHSGRRMTTEPPARDAVHARAVVVGGDGRVRPDLLRSAVESQSTPRALADPPDDHRYGALGLELEYPAQGIEVPPGVDPESLPLVVARSERFSVATEEVDGRLFVEIVGAPAGIVPGDTGRLDPDDYFRRLDELDRAFRARDLGSYFSSLGRRRPAERPAATPFSQVFSEDRGFTVAEEARGLSLRRTPYRDIINAQYTVGVPVAALYDALAHVLEGTWLMPAARVLREALHFGTWAAAEYVSDRYLGGVNVPPAVVDLLDSDEDVRAIRGVTALMYEHAGALASYYYDRSLGSYRVGQMKNYLAAASRTSLAGIRAGLSSRASVFLEEHAQDIKDRFVNAVMRGYRLDQPDSAPPLPYLDIEGITTDSGIALSDYLDNMLLDRPATVVQQGILGIRTNFRHLDTNPDEHGAPRQPLPLALLELRFYGPSDATSVADVRRVSETVIGWAKAGYEDIDRLRAAQDPEIAELSREDLLTLLNSTGRPAQELRRLLRKGFELEARLPQRIQAGPLLPVAAVRAVAREVLGAVAGRPSRNGYRAAYRALSDLVGVLENLGRHRDLTEDVRGHLRDVTEAVGTLREFFNDGGGTRQGRPGDGSGGSGRPPRGQGGRDTAQDRSAPAADHAAQPRGA
ncbi:hypothetical protein [Streptomyces sp. E-15]